MWPIQIFRITETQIYNNELKIICLLSVAFSELWSVIPDLMLFLLSGIFWVLKLMRARLKEIMWWKFFKVEREKNIVKPNYFLKPSFYLLTLCYITK